MTSSQPKPYAYARSDCPRLWCTRQLTVVGYCWRFQRSLSLLPTGTFFMTLGHPYSTLVSGMWLTGVFWLSHVQHQLLLFYAQSDDVMLLSLDADGWKLLQEARRLKVTRRLLLLSLTTKRLRRAVVLRAWERHVHRECDLARRQQERIRYLKPRLGST